MRKKWSAEKPGGNPGDKHAVHARVAAGAARPRASTDRSGQRRCLQGGHRRRCCYVSHGRTKGRTTVPAGAQRRLCATVSTWGAPCCHPKIEQFTAVLVACTHTLADYTRRAIPCVVRENCQYVSKYTAANELSSGAPLSWFSLCATSKEQVAWLRLAFRLGIHTDGLPQVCTTRHRVLCCRCRYDAPGCAVCRLRRGRVRGRRRSERAAGRPLQLAHAVR